MLIREKCRETDHFYFSSMILVLLNIKELLYFDGLDQETGEFWKLEFSKI